MKLVGGRAAPCSRSAARCACSRSKGRSRGVPPASELHLDCSARSASPSDCVARRRRAAALASAAVAGRRCGRTDGADATLDTARSYAARRFAEAMRAWCTSTFVCAATSWLRRIPWMRRSSAFARSRALTAERLQAASKPRSLCRYLRSVALTTLARLSRASTRTTWEGHATELPAPSADLRRDLPPSLACGESARNAAETEAGRGAVSCNTCARGPSRTSAPATARAPIGARTYADRGDPAFPGAVSDGSARTANRHFGSRGGLRARSGERYPLRLKTSGASGKSTPGPTAPCGTCGSRAIPPIRAGAARP